VPFTSINPHVVIRHDDEIKAGLGGRLGDLGMGDGTI